MSYLLQKDRKAPIGVFDYGIGGLTVIDALIKNLPNENFIFLADEAKKNIPEPEEETRRHRIEDAVRYTDFLRGHKVKMIVVACNIMSAIAIKNLQEHTDIPIVGLVQPAVNILSKKFADINLVHPSIAVFTTEIAANIKLFTKYFEERFPKIRVFEIGCGTLPQIIANNKCGTKAADTEVQKYTSKVPSDISAVLLACTRFPILINSFKKQFSNIPIIDPAETLPEIVWGTLNHHHLLADQQYAQNILYTTGDSTLFQTVAAEVLHNTNFIVKQA